MTARRCVITTMKDEGPFILEWVAYHRLIGFDDLLVFSNDCTDGSDDLLRALDAAGLIHHVDNSATPPDLPADPQNRAYRRAMTMPQVAGAEWVLVIDADEFLAIHPGEGRLDDLVAALPPGTDAVSAAWRIFGTGGRTGFQDRPVIGQFQRAAPRDIPVSFNHFGVKTLFRPGPVHRLGVHRPFLKGGLRSPDAPLLWVNGSGRNVTAHFRVKHWSCTPGNVGYDLCQINHYMIKAGEVFLMKRLRGTANSANAERIDFAYFDRFNSNHEQDDALQRWLGPVEAEIARLRAAHPAIADLHDATVARFRARIAPAVAEVAATSPEIHRRLFDPATIAREIAAQEAWLAARRAALAAPAAAPPAAPAPAPTAAAARDEAPDLPVEDEDDAPAAPAETPPDWLRDLRQSEHRRGFYQSDRDFAAVLAERDPGQLVISFDNLSSVRDPSLARLPWGYEFIRKFGWSHLGVMSFQPNWFRDPALFEFLLRQRDAGLFARFGRVALMGTSMGAYGAAAFASLVPGATVIALSPQSTLDPALVPWESRFAAGRKRDWSGPFRDAAAEARSAGRVYLFYDPLFQPDRQHAERFAGANVLHLKTRHSGHKSALFLRRAGLLSRVTEAAIRGELTEAGFYRLYREGREIPWFLNALTENVMARNRPALIQRTLRHIETGGRAPMAASMARRLGV